MRIIISMTTTTTTTTTTTMMMMIVITFIPNSPGWRFAELHALIALGDQVAGCSPGAIDLES